MPRYDYAREIHDLRDDWRTHEDCIEHDPEPKRKPYRCSDGMCGALDCARCYPFTWMIQEDIPDDDE